MDCALEVFLSEAFLSLDMLVALALAAEDVALEDSLAICLVLPQKRQRCWLKQCLRSSLVSLLSLPSFEERSKDPFGVPEVFEVLGLEFGFGVFLSLEPLFLTWGVQS